MRIARFASALTLVAMPFFCALLLEACGNDSARSQGDAGRLDATPRDARNDDARVFEPLTWSFRKVNLEVPTDFPAESPQVFDIAIAGTRRWASAQSFVVRSPGDTSHGPLLLWERTGRDDFRIVSIPETTEVWFPELCAASEEEVYVAFQNGIDSELRLLSRAADTASGFRDIVAPQPPGTGQRFFSAYSLACWPGGNLWFYGDVQNGDDVEHQVPVLFHRSSADSAWERIALAEGIEPTYFGSDRPLIRADGTGYYPVWQDEQLAIYERYSDGHWGEPGKWGNRYIFTMAGSPDGTAVAGTGYLPRGDDNVEEGGAGYLRLRNGQWTLEHAAGIKALWAASTGPFGLFIAGETDERKPHVALLRAGEMESQVHGVEGRMLRMRLASETRSTGLAIIENDARSDLFEVEAESM